MSRHLRIYVLNLTGCVYVCVCYSGVLQHPRPSRQRFGTQSDRHEAGQHLAL